MTRTNCTEKKKSFFFSFLRKICQSEETVVNKAGIGAGGSGLLKCLLSQATEFTEYQA